MQSGESGEGGSTVEDHSMAGWPAPTSQDPATTTFDRLLPQGNAPPAVNGLPANISAILQAVQDPALQGMLGAPTVNAPPPTLKPEEAELYQVSPSDQVHKSIRRRFSTFARFSLFSATIGCGHCPGSKGRSSRSWSPSPPTSSQLQPGDWKLLRRFTF